MSGVIGFTIMNGIYPVLFNLYLLRLGYGPETIGVVNAVGPLAYALFAVPAGLIGGRLSPHRTIALGVIVCLVCSGLQPLVGLAPASWQMAWILATQACITMGLALYFVNAYPFMVDATSARERSHAYSLRMVVDTLSGFLGSLAGGALPGLVARWLGTTLADPAPYRYALIFAALLGAPAIPVLLAIRGTAQVEQAGEEAPRAGAHAPVALIAMMALTTVLRAAGVGTTRMFFNVYLDDGLGVSTARIGALVALIQLSSAPAALVMPVLAARWGYYKVVVRGSVGMIASLLPLALVPHWAAATLGRMGVYALSSITDPAIGVYQMEIVPRRWRSTMAGVSSAALGLSWTALAWAGGYAIAALGYGTLFAGAGVLTALGTVAFWAMFRALPVRTGGDEESDAG
ncbi:MAG: MFS transporter [Anaerolineae bacterium]|nr:MFS transporter [Anaerolineae bacterium]